MTDLALPDAHWDLTGTAPDTERAWAAGFFDGEGWTGCTQTRSRHPVLRVSMAQAKDYQSLSRFMKTVGVGRLYGPYPGKKPGWSEQMFYNVHNWDAMQALFILWRFLGEVKKQQAHAAISEWHALKARNKEEAAARRALKMQETRERTHCGRGHELTPENVYFMAEDPLRPNCRECQRERGRRSYHKLKTLKT